MVEKVDVAQRGSEIDWRGDVPTLINMPDASARVSQGNTETAPCQRSRMSSEHREYRWTRLANAPLLFVLQGETQVKTCVNRPPSAAVK